ncbi:MAG: hypothetical protein AUG51_22215 [Acidobacteria bacterium 13_1_20CM_3_53_8]|nr:MAG: hypothetical protein AUH05_05185 [Ktedonobacter sp. 13_2_20CM_53_11]OLE51621.1 MAG: hypothetical protein AUG51_22215 [Acidobacteria bacterium 13_1_20CM_3_53_8]
MRKNNDYDALWQQEGTDIKARQRNFQKKEILVGNNAAYATFQHTIITLYNHNVLTLALLDELAREYTDTDIDSGGDTGLTTKDGKTLEEVCIGLVDPQWLPVKREDANYVNPKYWEEEERYEKWYEITNGRWEWS